MIEQHPPVVPGTLGQPLSNPSNKMDKVELRACFKIPWGPVFAEKAEWRDATKEKIPGGSSTEEQRSQAAFSAKTRAGL
jgi:hypothetical protein